MGKSFWWCCKTQVLRISVEFENLLKVLNIIAFEWTHFCHFAFGCVNVIRSFFVQHAGLDKNKTRFYVILCNISTFHFIWTSNYNDTIFSILQSKTLLDMGLNTVYKWAHCTQLYSAFVFMDT